MMEEGKASDVENVSDLKVSRVSSSPRYSNKVADIDTEMSKMRASLDIKEGEIALLKEELSGKDDMLRDLEAEVKSRRESEKRLFESLGEQAKELEQTKILVEESKLEIASLHDKLDESVHSQESSEDDISVQECDMESLKMELESTKEDLARAREGAEALQEEMESIKNELKAATEAEITSKKAMDDLALALKEVATDCTQAKEKLEAERLEAQEWREKLAAMEETHRALSEEAEVHKNTNERLRIEAEESVLAWSEKEAVFVKCIKKWEDEKNSLRDENDKLIQGLVNAENLSKKAKDENHKLRDILKQAVDEANIAKEASGIARAENAQLKDALMDKEEELEFALQEIERLMLSEAAANENAKTLKRKLHEAELANELKFEKLSRENSVQKDLEVERKKDEREQQNGKKEDRKEQPKEKKEKKDSRHEKRETHKDKKEPQQQQLEKKMATTCSFSLRDLKLSHTHKNKDSIDEEITKAAATNNNNKHGYGTEESEGDSPTSESDLFKGSIFDVAETPHATSTVHHRRKSSCVFLEDAEPMNSEDSESLEMEEGEQDKGGRKKKALIRRFGDLLIRRKSLPNKKEASCDHQDKPQLLLTPTSAPSSPRSLDR